MLFLQIRQAEIALADGRLDEAFELLRSPALRSHRRGQALVTELVARLVGRGQTHLEESRPAQALADCEKAQQLGGHQSEVLGLRNEIERVVVDSDRARRRHAYAGALETAAALVDSALGRQDMDRAVAELIRARGNGATDHRLRELDGNVREMLAEQIESALNQGQLDQLDGLMDRLTRLDPQGLPTQRLARAIEQARSAWEAVERGRPADASEALHRLRAQLPDARWIKDAIEQTEAAEQALRAVRNGPLGLLATSQPSEGDTTMPEVPQMPGNAHGRDARATAEGSLPSKVIIQVDGAGSFLVLTKTQVTLGPVSSSRLPDVALIAEAGASVATIERIEDDYFLQGKLLNSGDRITLSPRCRLTFALPNPSSTTATLELTSGRFPRADLRRVILLDRDLIIGPGASSHIRADHLTEPVVLHVRNGNLCWGRQTVAVGKPLTVAGASLVVTA